MSVRPSIAEMQRAGFVVGGEPLVALDLADTVVGATSPPTDLLDSTERAAAWWALQSVRLPEGPVPDPTAVRRLRTAIRDLLDSHLDGGAPRAASIEDVNAAAAAVPTSPRLVLGARGEISGDLRWHTEFGGNPALAAMAREIIDLLSSPEQLGRLRRCANPECTMLFLAENTRRQWCASNVCGNRVRVARHYRRTHDSNDKRSPKEQ